jgi:S1-C subfamily serine protease
MKKTVIAVVLASFVGVMGALQVDHYLGKKDTSIFATSSGSTGLISASYSAEIAAAPFDFTAAAKKASPSVVSVDQYRDVPVGFFSDETASRKTGTGSGVIVSEEGYVVTNNHVVARATKVRVRLDDGRTVDAKVLGTDPRSDLAVLKIDVKNLKAIEVGTSKDVQVGQWVLAVGNPLGFDDTVSVGVVSSLKRNLDIGNQGLVDAIQTDAAINQGNSGGALCNSQGQLIGINSAIASNTGGSIGIGFAIPVDRVKTVVDDIVKFGYARYAGLGITYDPRLDGRLADPNVRAYMTEQSQIEGFPSYGIVVQTSTGNAAKAGIEKFDVILAVNDQQINGTFDMNKVLVPLKPGDSVKVKYWRKGKELIKTVTLQEVHQPVTREE